jgi:uncharacterized protein YegL
MTSLIPDVSFIDNSEQRTPLILVLDCSGSMEGQPIAQLNQGLKLLEEELKHDVIAAKRVRLLVINMAVMMNVSCTATGVMRWTSPHLFLKPTA